MTSVKFIFFFKITDRFFWGEKKNKNEKFTTNFYGKAPGLRTKFDIAWCLKPFQICSLWIFFFFFWFCLLLPGFLCGSHGTTALSFLTSRNRFFSLSGFLIVYFFFFDNAACFVNFRARILSRLWHSFHWPCFLTSHYHNIIIIVQTPGGGGGGGGGWVTKNTKKIIIKTPEKFK